MEIKRLSELWKSYLIASLFSFFIVEFRMFTECWSLFSAHNFLSKWAVIVANHVSLWKWRKSFSSSDKRCDIFFLKEGMLELFFLFSLLVVKCFVTHGLCHLSVILRILFQDSFELNLLPVAFLTELKCHVYQRPFIISVTGQASCKFINLSLPWCCIGLFIKSPLYVFCDKFLRVAAKLVNEAYNEGLFFSFWEKGAEYSFGVSLVPLLFTVSNM